MRSWGLCWRGQMSSVASVKHACLKMTIGEFQLNVNILTTIKHLFLVVKHFNLVANQWPKWLRWGSGFWTEIRWFAHSMAKEIEIFTFIISLLSSTLTSPSYLLSSPYFDLLTYLFSLIPTSPYFYLLNYRCSLLLISNFSLLQSSQISLLLSTIISLLLTPVFLRLSLNRLGCSSIDTNNLSFL